jgi:FKBP-type peptidyl-prolyl cis-trans isomerase
MRRSLNRLLCVATTAVLAACNLDVAQPANEPSDPATETFDPSLKIDISKMQKTTAGTYYRDVTIGTGLTLGLGAGKFAVLSYVGFLKNASPFAQSLNQLIALSSLPPGLQDGLAGMKEGGERIIVVPSELGYANVPAPGVPPNSTLVFDVILNQVP